MKHNLAYALVLIAIVLLSACDKDEPNEATPDPVYIPISVETEMANQFNHGFATGDKENIYFYNYEADRSVKLYKKNRKTGDASVLDKLAAPAENGEVLYSSLYASGEWLYYCLFEVSTDNKNTIWRIKTDGSAKEKISGVSATDIRYYKNKIYYNAQSEPKGLYSVNMNGGEAEYISEELFRFSILNDRIYYLTYAHIDDVFSYMLNTCELDGSNKKVLYTTPGYMAYVVAKERIYLLAGEPLCDLVSIGLDGNNPKTLFSAFPAGSLNIQDNTLLIATNESNNRYGEGLYKYVDGYKMPILISATPTYSIMVVGGNKIIYQNENDKYERFGQLYQTDFNGNQNIKLVKSEKL